MQFIPEREHMKAGRYIGFAFLWDLENCVGVRVCIKDLHIFYFLIFKRQPFCSHCAPLLPCLFCFQLDLPRKVWSITKMATVKIKSMKAEQLKRAGFNPCLSHIAGRHLGERKSMLMRPTPHSQFVSVRSTDPATAESSEQMGKCTPGIYKTEKCTKQKNAVFQFSVVSVALSMLSTAHLVFLSKFGPELFCSRVILNAEKQLWKV